MASRIWEASALSNEAIARLPLEGYKVERVDGEIVVTPAGWEHEDIAGELVTRLRAHVRAKALGKVFGTSAGYDVPRSHNLRSPDVSFVSAARFSGTRGVPFPKQAPDLAAEIMSPSDRAARIRKKIDEYLREGVRVVWVFWPDKAKAEIHRPGRAVRIIGGDGHLDGDDVVPGFRVRLRDILQVD